MAFRSQGASVLETRKLCLIGFINRDPGIMRPFRASIFLKAVQHYGPHSDIVNTTPPKTTTTTTHLRLQTHSHTNSHNEMCVNFSSAFYYLSIFFFDFLISVFLLLVIVFCCDLVIFSELVIVCILIILFYVNTCFPHYTCVANSPLSRSLFLTTQLCL